MSDQPVEVPNITAKPVVVQEAKTSTSKAGWQSAVATFVPDGDTAYFKLGDGSNVKCRVDGIDSPETAKPKEGKPGQPYADAARNRLKEMVERKEVTVKIVEKASKKNHNRTMCQIEFEGANVSKTMVEEGLAWVYDKYVRDGSLKGIETQAKKEKRGLWVDPSPINPYIFRKSLEIP